MSATYRVVPFLLLASALSWQATAAAQGPSRTTASQQKAKPDLSPRAFRRLQLTGVEVAANVQKLTQELRWHRSRPAVLAAARASKRPAVFIQALGELEGFL